MHHDPDPPGATFERAPQLAEQSQFSFRLTSGTPAQLAEWLQARGYSARRVDGGCWRCEKPTPRRERAVCLIFASGSVLCQGNPQPRDELIALLAGLGVDAAPEAEQLALFAEVRR